MAEKRNGAPPKMAIERGRATEVRRANPVLDIPRVPMDEYRSEVVECIKKNSNAVIIGETGSGKTTRIPVFLLDAFPDAKIAITQPRRVAARSVARFVADCRGGIIGDEIGYQVRFEDATTEGTRANFMTDGILLRKLQFDPLLSEYDIIMVDEAHERNLNIDFVLGLLKRVQAERKKQGMKELKVIATSATIEKKKFTDYFGGSPVVEVPGRMYPVEVRYEQERAYDYTKTAAQKVKEIVSGGGEGDVLIFMPGEEEIRRTIQEIENLKLSGIDAMPLFGAMAPEDQDRIFLKNSKRKVIVSTNIAETSVTIDGVRFVIDSGLIKQKEFNPSTGIEALVVKRHAKSGCEQRKGRAGRTAPGVCYRLYPESDYNARDDYQTPEIARSNLDHVILAMKKIGIDDVRSFEFIDPPKEETISQAIETLKMLGALNADEKLTDIGRTMAELPLRPEIARMVIESEKYHCTGKICTIAAMMGEKSVFVRPKEKAHEADVAHAQFAKGGSDFLKLLEVWQQWSASGFDQQWARDHFLNVRQLFEVREIRSQLMRELKRQDIAVDDENGNDPIAIQKCIASGMIQYLMMYAGHHSYERVVRMGSSVYGSGGIFIHPSSSAFSGGSQLMIGADVVTTSKTFARRCQPIKPEWLPEIAPQLLEETGKTFRYDLATDSVIENVSYSLRGKYGTIAEQERSATDDVVIEEQFIRALSEGKVDLPCVKHNTDALRILQELYVRSGGKVAVPNILTWYKEHLEGIKNKKEAQYIDEKLRIIFDKYCSPKTKAEIDANYPETISIQGRVLKIEYEYRPENQRGWSESEKAERFKAIVTIPGDIIFTVNEADFPLIGSGGRPEILYRSGEIWNSFTNADLELLKQSLDTKRLENAWQSFKKPDLVPVKAEALQPLPSLESIGARPVPYAKNYKGEDAVAYPAYRAEQTYNYDSREYVYVFSVVYYRTEEEAKQSNNLAFEIKEQGDAKIRRKTERDTLLAPAKEQYIGMSDKINELRATYTAIGLSYSDYNGLVDTLRNVKAILDSSDADPKRAVGLMSDIDEVIARAKQERERRTSLIQNVEARIRELAVKVNEISYDTYTRFGLSHDQYSNISRKWREAHDMLNTTDRYGRSAVPDPERANILLDEIVALLPGSQEKKESNTQKEDEGVRIENEEQETNVFARILRKMTGREPQKKEEQQQETQTLASPVSLREVQPVEKEEMTEDLRVQFTDQLAYARFLLDSVRAVSDPNKDEPNAVKISKTRVRAAEAKRDLSGVEKELTTTDDVASIRGKVMEMERRGERVAKELARLQDHREDWFDWFKIFMTRTKEIAKAQDIELDELMEKKIRQRVVDLAKQKGEIADLDGELEVIILDSI